LSISNWSTGLRTISKPFTPDPRSDPDPPLPSDRTDCRMGRHHHDAPRLFDHWRSDLHQVVEFQDTPHLGLVTRPWLRALLRPERIFDPRQPVEGDSFQH
jgi:hypothetical protein